MNKTDTIIKVKNLEFLCSRIIGLDKSDTVNANFHLKIYLVSDATFTLEFDTIQERDDAYDYVSKKFHLYIDQVPTNSALDINIKNEMTVLKQVQSQLRDLQTKIRTKWEAFSHVGMKETLYEDLADVSKILSFTNKFTKQ